jgi:hypothetical protein
MLSMWRGRKGVVRGDETANAVGVGGCGLDFTAKGDRILVAEHGTFGQGTAGSRDSLDFSGEYLDDARTPGSGFRIE